MSALDKTPYAELVRRRKELDSEIAARRSESGWKDFTLAPGETVEFTEVGLIIKVESIEDAVVHIAARVIA